MQPEIAPEPNPDVASAESKPTVKDGEESAVARPATVEEVKNIQPVSQNGRFPPPKTDKPRPHVCGTCGRSFARLEHLKRHERSHTKEKPFECPDCARCFARRDLLLRHQQKLHMTNNNASSRPRGGRRESVGGAAVSGARVRKSSIAGGTAASSTGIGVGNPRPRANTISHIDLSSLGLMGNVHAGLGRINALGFSGQQTNSSLGYDYRGMSTAPGSHGNLHGLAKLDTHATNSVDMSGNLRTAPPYANFGGFAIDQLFGQGTTINPAQLHFGGPASAVQPQFPSLDPFTPHSTVDSTMPVNDFGWARGWNMQIPYEDNNEQAIDESSPSRSSSDDSPQDFGESLGQPSSGLPMQNNFHWTHQDDVSLHPVSSGLFQLDMLSSGLSNLDFPPNTISPDSLGDPTPTGTAFFHQAMHQQQQQQQQQQAQQQQQQQQQPQQQQQQAQQLNHHQSLQTQFLLQDPLAPHEAFKGQPMNFFAPSLSNFSSDSPSIMSSSSLGGSARHSSVTSASTASITEVTRQALLIGLSQPSTFGHGSRKYSQPSISSPLSPNAMRGCNTGPSLPSTADLRRYVDSFIRNGQPHLPVTHIPTLSFDPLDFGASRDSPSPLDLAQSGILAGGGCLILGMAAIGALYEFEHAASKELFEAAKKMISLYLEDRRKADMSAAVSGVGGDYDHRTPVWLVQAMLLTVIYGHMCGDKTAADIASNHCAALVTLARAADLLKPPPAPSSNDPMESSHPDAEMIDDAVAPGDSVSRHHNDQVELHTQWIAWKFGEERKRTLFAIFILSSLLITAYNQNPSIMNSEILLDLPCEEELYAAESAAKWQERGGLAAAERSSISFAGALSTLLTASQRQGRRPSGMYSSNGRLNFVKNVDASLESELRPSTFGCLILINALHNYIWETRSRHHGRPWTPQETESMFTHIEPALNAWQAAWKANEHHKLERPNPFGLGPLAADSIPLLDLAFVRLFVNLGRSKEAFFARDFDAMSEELSRGDELAQHAGASPGNGTHETNGIGSSSVAPGSRRQSLATVNEQASPRRERHLRKAAFYAADSLIISCTYNLTYADMAAHELPIQSAMCFFDCAQVLAEWACTVQERVGQYLGVLGRDQIDLSAVPAIMLLENEDIELLHKIEGICESLEQKRYQQENMLSIDLHGINSNGGMNNVSEVAACNYGSKILRVMAPMLEKATVWPITHVMANALRIQAGHMDRRSNASTLT